MATSVNNVPKGHHPPAKQQKAAPDFKALARKAASKVAKAVGFSTPNPPAEPPPGTCLVNGRLCLTSDWPLSLEQDTNPSHTSPDLQTLTPG
jgi:hypothetical protein